MMEGVLDWQNFTPGSKTTQGSHLKIISIKSSPFARRARNGEEMTLSMIYGSHSSHADSNDLRVERGKVLHFLLRQITAVSVYYYQEFLQNVFLVKKVFNKLFFVKFRKRVGRLLVSRLSRRVAPMKVNLSMTTDVSFLSQL